MNIPDDLACANPPFPTMAYLQGAVAFKAGKPITVTTYTRMRHRADFERGWRDAEKESQEVKNTTEIIMYQDIVIDPSAIKPGPLQADAPEVSTSILYDYEMKSWPSFFSKMIAGQKKHDMRDKRDRNYKVGDKVLLREWEPFGSGYTGRWAIVLITYITSNDSPCAMSSAALDRNFVILSVEILGTGE